MSFLAGGFRASVAGVQHSVQQPSPGRQTRTVADLGATTSRRKADTERPRPWTSRTVAKPTATRNARALLFGACAALRTSSRSVVEPGAIAEKTLIPSVSGSASGYRDAVDGRRIGPRVVPWSAASAASANRRAPRSAHEIP